MARWLAHVHVVWWPQTTHRKMLQDHNYVVHLIIVTICTVGKLLPNAMAMFNGSFTVCVLLTSIHILELQAVDTILQCS